MSFMFKGLKRSRESGSQSPLPEPSPRKHKASRRYSSQAVAPQDRPAQTTIHPASTATASSAPIGKGDNYGIQILHDGRTEACVDIVFVHGLTGDSYNTWLHEKSGIHWPSKLLRQDLPDTRILSFGYDADIVHFWNPASNSRLSNHAENLVGELVRERERTDTETRKLLFVAHSLGGLVTEHALSHSRNTAEEHLRQVERCTAGIVFLGVPHCGADLAKWAKLGTQMVGILRRTNKDIVGVLDPGSEMLREVEKGFHTILRQRKNEGSEISITCFYEELPVIAIGEIVPLHSAEIKGYSYYGIRANHMDMTKFPTRKDQGYRAISGELQRWQKSVYTALGNEPRSAVEKVAVRREKPPKATTWPDATDHRSANLWMVPRAVNPLYTGRGELGERLAQMLSFDPSTPPTQQRTFVIIGVGGIGKSEVCLKFVEDHGDEYWGIFWLDARSIATAEHGYIDIGRRCGIAEPSVENVKSWLACNSQRWLLIIDNADDREIDYSKYIPPGKRGDILLTTRNPECITYETVGSETLADLEHDLARKLLFRATGIVETRWKEKEKACAAIVSILGSHTLAIIQAGAFVRQKLCTLEQYPTIFQQQKGQLLKFHSKQHVSTYGNVYTTFEVSAEHLQNSELPEDLDALNLLHIFAFMHNSGISETMFQRASEYASDLRDMGNINDEEVLSLSARHVARLPEYAQQGWSSLQGRLPWRKACAVLESLSIITTHEDDDSITISAHSLVYAWAKERQDDQSQCRAWQSAATILALSCEGRRKFCPFFRFLQPHVRACVNHEIEKYTQNMSDMEAAQTLFQLADVLLGMEEQSSLSLLVQRMRLRLQDRYGAHQEMALQIHRFSGEVCLQQGKYGEAVELFKHIAKVRETLAEDHPSRLASQHALAHAYQKNRQVKKAKELFEYIVEIKEKLAEDHPSRLASQHELACAYQANGQIKEAIELFEYIVRVDKLAEDHPDRLASQYQLAYAYRANGQVDEAIGLFEHIVKVGKRVKDHPHLLSYQHQLALVYRANGQVDEAIEVLEHIVKVDKRAEDHPKRLASQHTLARAYRTKGQVDEATSQELPPGAREIDE